MKLKIEWEFTQGYDEDLEMELMMVLREFFKETGFRESKTDSLVRERAGRLVYEHR